MSLDLLSCCSIAEQKVNRGQNQCQEQSEKEVLWASTGSLWEKPWQKLTPGGSEEDIEGQHWRKQCNKLINK